MAFGGEHMKGMTNAQAGINAVEARVGTLETDSNAIKNRVGTLESEMDAVEAKYTEQEGKIVTLEGKDIDDINLDMDGSSLIIKATTKDGTIIQNSTSLSSSHKTPIIRFTNYSGTIPVNDGCMYSTDGNTWVTVSEPSDIPSPFTGWVKFNGVVTGQAHTSKSYSLNYTYNRKIDSSILGYWNSGPRVQFGTTTLMADDSCIFRLQEGGSYTKIDTFSIGYSDSWAFCKFKEKAYLIIKKSNTTIDVYTYTSDGTNTKVTGITIPETSNGISYAFGLENYIILEFGYAYASDTVYYRMDKDFNVSTLDLNLMKNNNEHLKYTPYAFANKIWCIGGGSNYYASANYYTDTTDTVVLYDENGVSTNVSNLSNKVAYPSILTIGENLYVCGGGIEKSRTLDAISNIDMYDKNGTKTTLGNLSYSVVDTIDCVGNDQYGIIGPGYSRITSISSNASDGLNKIQIINKDGIVQRTDDAVPEDHDFENFRLATAGKSLFTIIHNTTNDDSYIVDLYSNWTYKLDIPITEFTDYIVNGVEAIGTADESKTFTKTIYKSEDTDYKWTYEIRYENGNISSS